MHEGKQLKEYINRNNLKARKICFDLGRSSNYLQAQYKKKVLDRKTLETLNEYFGVNILEEIQYKEQSQHSKNETSSMKGTRKRVIIDFIDGNVVSIETLNIEN